MCWLQHFCWLCGGATGLSHTWTSITGHTCGRFKEETDARIADASRCAETLHVVSQARGLSCVCEMGVSLWGVTKGAPLTALTASLSCMPNLGTESITRIGSSSNKVRRCATTVWPGIPALHIRNLALVNPSFRACCGRNLKRLEHFRSRWEAHTASQKMEEEQTVTIGAKITELENLEPGRGTLKDFTWLTQASSTAWALLEMNSQTRSFGPEHISIGHTLVFLTCVSHTW